MHGRSGVDERELGERDATTGAIVQLRRAHVAVSRQEASGVDITPVLLMEGDAGGEERVIADRARQAERAAASLDDAEHAGAAEGFSGKRVRWRGWLGRAARRARPGWSRAVKRRRTCSRERPGVDGQHARAREPLVPLANGRQGMRPAETRVCADGRGRVAQVEAVEIPLPR